MKLPIKKVQFDKIKSGQKTMEFRDGHITFICEETGEELRKEIFTAGSGPRERVLEMAKEDKEEIGKLLKENNIVYFMLE